MHWAVRLAVVLTAALTAGAVETLTAQRLVSHSWMLGDGLAHNVVTAVHQDSKGYLWVGTGEGVSRFDGYEFRNYGVLHGLEIPLVNDLAEDERGRIWVATNGGGIARFDDRPAAAPGSGPGGSRFSSFPVGPGHQTNQINDLVIAGGEIWCATDLGAYRAAVPAGDEPPAFERVGPFAAAVEAAFRDSKGRLWMAGITTGVVLMEGQRHTVFGSPPGQGRIRTIAEVDGRVLVGAGHELWELSPAAGTQWRQLPLGFASDQQIWSLMVDAAHGIWIGTSKGLSVLRDGRVTQMTPADGMSPSTVRAVVQDRAQRIWVASEAGLINLSPREVQVFRVAGNLPLTRADAITGSSPQDLLVRLDTHWVRVSETIDGIAAKSAPMPFDGDLECSSSGACWGLAGDGVYRFPSPAEVGNKSARIMAFPAGVTAVTHSGAVKQRIYRDRAGAVWFGTSEPALYRVRDGERQPQITRMPLEIPMAPLVSDASGTLWVAHMSGFGRVKGDRVEMQTVPDGLDGRPRSALVDARGRLWIGLRFGGVVMTEHPEAHVPQWIRYSTRNGLASDTVWALTDDPAGRIYVVNGRGLDRINPDTGQIRHFARSEMPAGRVDCLTDTEGRVWIASGAGVSRLDPADTAHAADAPRVFIRRVEVGNHTLPVLESGTDRLDGVTVLPGGDRFAVHFGGVALAGRETLRYQYRLEGLDTDWSAPAQERSVTYGRLPRGAYRFLVRAVDAEGSAGETASVSLTVLPPVWQRAWFILLVIATAAGLVVAVTVRRAARRRATEALRRQVATDLHDDVGSGLSQIAIMSEVLQRQTVTPAADGLAEIARTARSLREVMSDIVWAISPGTERMSELVDRMRHAAFTLIDFGGLRVSFDAPPAPVLDAVTMTPDRRRHLLLMFKEAVTNVARHARATQLAVRIVLERNHLHLSISDDGCGFDTGVPRRGQGLNSLARRAAAIGARLTVESATGAGARLDIQVPL